MVLSKKASCETLTKDTKNSCDLPTGGSPCDDDIDAKQIDQNSIDENSSSDEYVETSSDIPDNSTAMTCAKDAKTTHNIIKSKSCTDENIIKDVNNDCKMSTRLDKNVDDDKTSTSSPSNRNISDDFQTTNKKAVYQSPQDSPSTPKTYWIRTCDRETVTPIEGKLTGHIPTWLNGRLTRNGPGKTFYGDTEYNHVFDGSAYLHQFNIEDGRVTYQSRFIQSDTYKRNSCANRIVVSEFGTVAYPDPCKTLLQRFMSTFDPLDKKMTDNCSVNVFYLRDELYAMTETPFIRRIDPETLDCIGEKTDLSQYITINQATAHPHIDPDGTIYNMGNSFTSKNGPHYNIIKIPPQKNNVGVQASFEHAEIVASIPCQWRMHPSYYHSFGMSDNYFVFVEMPFVCNLRKLLFSFCFGKPYSRALEWYSNEKSRFHVIHRRTGKVMETLYVTEAFLTFHHANAFEKDGQLVVDVCGINDGKTVSQFLLKNFEDPVLEISPEAVSTVRRYVLPLDLTNADEGVNLVTLENSKCCAYKTKKLTIEIIGEELNPTYFDFPRINYRYNGKEYSYLYGTEFKRKGVECHALAKMNVTTGDLKLWKEEDKVMSEPVFVAEPDALEEDQGVVLSSLIDKNDTKYVGLLVMDATSWTELGRVEFQANGEVTSTFHGMFAGKDELVHRY